VYFAEDLDVFFDDLSLQHSSGPIVRTEDYYPFGLSTGARCVTKDKKQTASSQSCTKDGSRPTTNVFQKGFVNHPLVLLWQHHGAERKGKGFRRGQVSVKELNANELL
jgi:hypothetical protein